jgi:hypothetical protein
MIELLKQEIVKYGDQATIVPINRLYNIQQDIKDLKDSGILNNF